MKTFYITFAISICLIVGGFFCPPMGIIHGSVLIAVGELLLFPLTMKLPEAIKAGRSIKVRKGDFSAEVTAEERK